MKKSIELTNSRSYTKKTHRPLIILGAARSGTKILRDTLSTHPSLIAIPYDINFVWKYDQYKIKHDELTPDELTECGSKFIHQFFESFHRNQPHIRVIEKTVSNTVRVDFVHKVFPDCQFIHLIRDGRDVAMSSMTQWQEPLDYKAVFHKLQYFPTRALPNYALQYALSYLFRIISREKRVATWGVALKDLDQLLQRYSLLEVCGIQWQRCVTSTINSLEAIHEDNKIEVRYESFVNYPTYEIQRILEFLQLDASQEAINYMAKQVKSSYVNKWENQIGKQDLKNLMLHISETIQQLGYEEANIS